ncbi:hypothetical protein D3C72_2530380 [compost metagenome]
MADVCVVLLNGRNNVAFHDRHVVNVVEQLEVFGTNHFTKSCTPGCVVAHVVAVIDFAIEQLHDHRNAMLFS